MGMLTWVMVGLAIWHFAVFVPDRFWGGIVGAFVGSIVGAALVGLAINGFSIPGRDETDLVTGLQGVPGSLIGMAVVYVQGVRRGYEPLHL